ncbi:MAG: hypothetical protein RLZ75_3244, partial [Pseudomonadota bacterium]
QIQSKSGGHQLKTRQSSFITRNNVQG